MKIFFDGGWRPGSGMETAVVARGRVFLRRDLGPGSSMEAEWLALLDALRIAREIGVADTVLLGDAAAVIAQADGAVRCRGDNARHFETFRALSAGAQPPRLRYVRRNRNLAGIALARLHAG